MKLNEQLEQAIFKYQTFIPTDMHFELRQIASGVRRLEAVAKRPPLGRLWQDTGVILCFEDQYQVTKYAEALAALEDRDESE